MLLLDKSVAASELTEVRVHELVALARDATMASIRCLPFTIEANAAEGRVLFRVKNQSWPIFRWPRKFVSSAALRGFGNSSTGEGDCSRSLSSTTRSLRATAAGWDFNNGEPSEDALEATIEKSKKVLAMQRELLDQVTEFSFDNNKSNYSKFDSVG